MTIDELAIRFHDEYFRRIYAYSNSLAMTRIAWEDFRESHQTATRGALMALISEGVISVEGIEGEEDSSEVRSEAR